MEKYLWIQFRSFFFFFGEGSLLAEMGVNYSYRFSKDLASFSSVSCVSFPLFTPDSSDTWKAPWFFRISYLPAWPLHHDSAILSPVDFSVLFYQFTLIIRFFPPDSIWNSCGILIVIGFAALDILLVAKLKTSPKPNTFHLFPHG